MEGDKETENLGFDSLYRILIGTRALKEGEAPDLWNCFNLRFKCEDAAKAIIDKVEGYYSLKSKKQDSR